ncbi:MAG TPA: anthranilate phosphoribosyltransferase [Verrucomicrobiales bacterium]|nr:anthranilate phosphoribosyltransferase [Verrucomicrobiales bacterium]
MKSYIDCVESGRELDSSDVGEIVRILVDEDAEPVGKARFLEGFAKKGETAAEIALFVSELVERAVDPEVQQLSLGQPTIDVCGTGGDKLNLFNVSTTSMFVIAAGGAVVLKHGNRGITSKSGGADVLEELGVRIDLSPERFRNCLTTAGLGFLFAPLYHPAFKAIMPVRKLLAERGVRTIFNLIGPLLNPARPDCQLVGVFSPELPPVYADILQRLGRRSAWAVHGETLDGRPVDELSTMGPTTICRTLAGENVKEVISPQDYGMSAATPEDLRGGDAKQNARFLTEILAGRDRGPRLDIVLLNAGAGLACVGLAKDLQAGIQQARELVETGAALEKLHALQEAAG